LRAVAEASRDEAEGVEGASAEVREVSVAGRGEEREDMEDEFGGDGVEHGLEGLRRGEAGAALAVDAGQPAYKVSRGRGNATKQILLPQLMKRSHGELAA
jgi:hypothetical protein